MSASSSTAEDKTDSGSGDSGDNSPTDTRSPKRFEPITRYDGEEEEEDSLSPGTSASGTVRRSRPGRISTGSGASNYGECGRCSRGVGS